METSPFQFLEVKFSIYLNRRVFVMPCLYEVDYDAIYKSDNVQNSRYFYIIKRLPTCAVDIQPN